MSDEVEVNEVQKRALAIRLLADRIWEEAEHIRPLDYEACVDLKGLSTKLHEVAGRVGKSK